MHVEIGELLNGILIFVLLLLIVLTFTTYQFFKDYLHKWRELKPVPGISPTYPFLGNALNFKSNRRGKCKVTTRLLGYRYMIYYKIKYDKNLATSLCQLYDAFKNN